MSKIPKTPLTRQHFEYFAWCVSIILDDEYFTLIKEWLAEALRLTNPAFDKERFKNRCDELRAEYILGESQ